MESAESVSLHFEKKLGCKIWLKKIKVANFSISSKKEFTRQIETWEKLKNSLRRCWWKRGNYIFTSSAFATRLRVTWAPRAKRKRKKCRAFFTRSKASGSETARAWPTRSNRRKKKEKSSTPDWPDWSKRRRGKPNVFSCDTWHLRHSFFSPRWWQSAQELGRAESSVTAAETVDSSKRAQFRLFFFRRKFYFCGRREGTRTRLRLPRTKVTTPGQQDSLNICQVFFWIFQKSSSLCLTSGRNKKVYRGTYLKFVI